MNRRNLLKRSAASAMGISMLRPGRALAQDAPRLLVSLLESSTLLVPEWHTLNPYGTPQNAWRTSVLTALQVGPIDLFAGDVLDLRLQHLCDVEENAASFYTINGQQSEHWFLYVMASSSIRIRKSSGVYLDGVLPAAETNWDWLTHHLPIDRSLYYQVQEDIPGALIQDRIYFKSSMSYTLPDPADRQIQINGGTYPRLQAGVFR